MDSLLQDLFGHQAWADAEHWGAIENHPVARDDQAIRDRLHHLHLDQRLFIWVIGDLATEFAKAPSCRNHCVSFEANATTRILAKFNIRSLALRLVSELHDSFREALCRDESQFRVFALPKELLTAPDNDRMDREIEYVDQVLLQQSLSEKTMAQCEKIPSFLFFELGHFSNNIVSNNGRVIPFGPFQLG